MTPSPMEGINVKSFTAGLLWWWGVGFRIAFFCSGTGCASTYEPTTSIYLTWHRNTTLAVLVIRCTVTCHVFTPRLLSVGSLKYDLYLCSLIGTSVEPLDCTHVNALGSRGSSFSYLCDMEIRIIVQPPYAFLAGFEAVNRIDEADNIVVDGVAFHFLLLSVEFRWN